MDTSDLEPLRLSRDLEAVFQREESLRAQARRGEPLDDPFLGRLFPGKMHFEAALGLAASDPLRLPLVTWIHELIRARVQLPWTARALWLEYGERLAVNEPRAGQRTRAEVRLEALGTLGEERRSWNRVRDAFAEPTASTYFERNARLLEIDRRLGGPADLLSPLTEGSDVVSLARRVLDRTDEAVVAARGLDEVRVAEELVAAAGEGWPARLKPDTIVDLLDARAWIGSFELKVEPLPERINPVSFLLALGAFGRALSLARMRIDLPFVVVRPVGDLLHEASRALFAMIPLAAPFLSRRLGIGPARVERARRALSLSFLLEVRIRAARTLMHHSALLGQKQARELAEELAPRLSSGPLSVEATVGRLLREGGLGRGIPERGLVALLEGGARSLDARVACDEDWFNNPRFREEFIDLGRSVPSAQIALSRLEGSGFAWLDELTRGL